MQNKYDYYYLYLKRGSDILFATTLLIIFSPITIFTAIIIKLTSPGPIFADVPERVGKKGRLFKMYKFRSMIVNAHHLLRHDDKLKDLYEEYKKGSYKLHQDPRITTIGRIIRKHSIDEIPQLFNVIIGDMSLVGPRAYYPDELEEQQKKYPYTRKLVKKVLSVKPGITGLWQVSGRSAINFDKRISIDAKYINQISMVSDLKIILRTPWVMISGKGAV